MTEPTKHETRVGDITDSNNIAIGTNAQAHTINIIQPQPYRPPLQRPPRAEHFQDRKAELAQLLDDLQPGNVVTICGPGGMGKTALAAEAVWTLAPDDEMPDRFPDGIFFHSFYNQPQAELALEQIALSFGEDPRSSVQAAAQRALSGLNALLVLDGTEAADDLRSVLNVRNRCSVLVTSRKRVDAVAERQDLPPLPSDDASILLQEWAGANPITLDTSQQIVEMVGRLPLAVRLAGRYMAESGIGAEDYRGWLGVSPLAALDQGQRRERSIPLLLKRSVSQVSEQAQAVLAVLGWLALAPFPIEAVAESLALEDRWQALRVLGELVAYGLLIKDGEAYELSHALIHAYAREELTPPTDTPEQLVGWMVAAVKQSEGDLGALAALRSHVVTLQRRCAEMRMPQAVLDLAWAIEDYLDLQGLWVERLIVIEAALKAARSSGSQYDEGAWLGNLGNAYADLGRLDEAIDHYQQALAISHEIGDRRGEGTRLGNLGNAYRNLGRLDEAIDHYQQALAISIDIGDRRGEGNHLGNLGNAYADLGRLDEAIDHYQQALAIQRDIGDRRGEGNQLGNLGIAYYSLGRVDEAIDHFQQAIHIFEEIKSPNAETVRQWLAELNEGAE